MVIINSTFTKNKAQGASGGTYSQNNGRGGAINFEYAQQANLFNNVIWGNSANGSSEGDSSIYYSTGTNSDIRGSNNSIQLGGRGGTTFNKANIDDLKLFWKYSFFTENLSD